MIKKYLLRNILFITSVFLMGCEGYLDVVPENDIETIETNFEKREDALAWLKTCYASLEVNAASKLKNPAFLGADEFCAGDNARSSTFAYGYLDMLKIGDGLQMAQSPYGNVWHRQEHYAAIRYCNIFLENIDHVYNMEDEEKVIWAAEVKAVKAFYYFDLMRRYGPIVLIDENIHPNASIETMKKTRRPIDECVEAIVKLCDEVMPILPQMREKEDEHVLFFNREAVATLKALTLLYAASPLFNGNVTLKNFKNKDGEQLFPDYDKEKWRRAALACDSALMYCNLAGKDLVSGSGDRPTPLLNKMKDIERTWLGDEYDCKEAIYMVNTKNSGGYLYSFYGYFASDAQYTEYYDWNSQGCLGAPMKMVEMFYTDHGLPIDEDNQWVASKYAFTKEVDEKYRDVLPLDEAILSLHRRREPRFYAMIAGDRTCWYRRVASYGSAQYKALLMKNRQGEETGSRFKRLDETSPQNITGYWIKKWISSEIQTRTYIQSSNSTLRAPAYVFRLAELYLAAAEAWNEYEGPSEKVYNYLDKVRERAGIPKVRDAWGTYAKNPEKVNKQDGLREIIQQEWNIEFAFEGRRYWNLRRWMTAEKELNAPQYGWNVLSSTKEGFYCETQGGLPIVVWKKRKFEVPKDYFTPIRAEEILVSGIVQNPGW